MKEKLKGQLFLNEAAIIRSSALLATVLLSSCQTLDLARTGGIGSRTHLAGNSVGPRASSGSGAHAGGGSSSGSNAATSNSGRFSDRLGASDESGDSSGGWGGFSSKGCSNSFNKNILAMAKDTARNNSGYYSTRSGGSGSTITVKNSEGKVLVQGGRSCHCVGAVWAHFLAAANKTAPNVLNNVNMDQFTKNPNSNKFGAAYFKSRFWNDQGGPGDALDLSKRQGARAFAEDVRFSKSNGGNLCGGDIMKFARNRGPGHSVILADVPIKNGQLCYYSCNSRGGFGYQCESLSRINADPKYTRVIRVTNPKALETIPPPGARSRYADEGNDKEIKKIEHMI